MLHTCLFDKKKRFCTWWFQTSPLILYFINNLFVINTLIRIVFFYILYHVSICSISGFLTPLLSSQNISNVNSFRTWLSPFSLPFYRSPTTSIYFTWNMVYCPLVTHTYSWIHTTRHTVAIESHHKSSQLRFSHSPTC